MAGEFDFGLGTDPFGGGGGDGIPSSGFNLLPKGLDSFQAPIFSEVAPREPMAGGGGLYDFAKGLFARGQDPGAPRGEDPGAPARPGAPGGVLSDLSSIAKGIMPVAQLGLAGLGVKNQLDAAHMARQQSGNLAQFQQIQRESAQPLQQFGTQQLARAGAGQIDPAVQQEIDNLVAAQKIQARQWAARNQITDSTMIESILREIDNKAEAMKAQVIGMDKNTAIQALQAAMGGATAGGQTASREQSQLDALIAESNKALATLAGSA
jgi:hypothetical protein